MNYNTFLTIFGFNPDNFKTTCSDPISGDDVIELYVEQRTDLKRICPFCNSNNIKIKDYDTITVSLTTNPNEILKLYIKKVRFLCKDCKRSFTPTIENIDPYCTISNKVKLMIVQEFEFIISFSNIAERYNVSITTIFNIFDLYYPVVPRRTMPKILCIDEFHFSKEYDQNYCCALVDMSEKKLVDVIKNRKKEYLNEYFGNIPLWERENVRFFISDLYDEYKSARQKFFPNATHIADRFHIVLQLTRAINKRRVKVMNKIKDSNKMLYNFMKKNWVLFERSRFSIPNKEYKNSKTRIIYSYDELFYDCLKLDNDLSIAYEELQRIISKKHFTKPYDEVEFFVKISERLSKCDDIEFKKVADTYIKWLEEISNAYTDFSINNHLSNSMAENMNNHIKTIIKISYGMNNFERLRKRAIIVANNNKRKSNID